ncbi:glutamine hydrolyzing CTP synthase [archaeon]
MKFIVVTGGVLSGLGKGIVTSSIGKILESRGYKVMPVKFDGYLNVDAGTMNPYRHGEVFVLDDGTECDMDLGNYERFLNITAVRANNPTGGKIFEKVLAKERKGEYLGVDVQFIPHVTGEIKDWVRGVGKDTGADVIVIEVGGTVGDIENSYFIEAMRELHQEEGHENVVFCHVTLVPKLKVVGEQKTKPTQQSIKQLLGMGVQPDFVLCRCDEPLDDSPREKIALFGNVKPENVISDHDCDTIYEVPFVLESDDLGDKLLKRLEMEVRPPSLLDWRAMVDNIKNPEKEITVAITGKYTALKDSYVSIMEALTHAGAHHHTKINLVWVETTNIEDKKITVEKALEGVDGIIVPGGFGSRGTEGKIACVKYCRENNIPYLGLCYGFQMAVIDAARNMCGLEGANSTEADPKSPHPVITILPDSAGDLGGTMRLGAYEALLKKGSRVAELYGKTKVSERHRHRYEVNPDYIEKIEAGGLVFSGRSEDGRLMEFLELPDHKFFIGTQAHPEFKTHLEEPAPLFYGFVGACL